MLKTIDIKHIVNNFFNVTYHLNITLK